MPKGLKHTLETATGFKMEYQIDEGTKFLRIRLPTNCKPKLKNKILTTARTSQYVRANSVVISGLVVKMRLRGSTDKMMNSVMKRIADAIDRHNRASPDYADTSEPSATVLSITFWTPDKSPRTLRRSPGNTLHPQTV
jgi:hypothetical protein